MDSVGRLDRREIDHAAFGLGDDFVFHDEDVAGLKAEAALAEGREKFVGEGIAGMDLVCQGYRDQTKFSGQNRLALLAPLCA